MILYTKNAIGPTEVSNDVIIWLENEKEINIRISACMTCIGSVYRPSTTAGPVYHG